MMVQQQWTGWNKNRSEELLLLQLLQPVIGMTTGSILLIHLGTLILQWRLSGLSAFLMEP